MCWLLLIWLWLLAWHLTKANQSVQGQVWLNDQGEFTWKRTTGASGLNQTIQEASLRRPFWYGSQACLLRLQDEQQSYWLWLASDAMDASAFRQLNVQLRQLHQSAQRH